MPTEASSRRRMYAGSTSMPARNVSTIDAKDAMKSSHCCGVQVEDVPDDDAERQLDQRDGDAELDRDDARDEDYDCRGLRRVESAPRLTSTSRRQLTFGRGHQPDTGG